MINKIKEIVGLKDVLQEEERIAFDEQPNFSCPLSEINLELAVKLFSNISKSFTTQTAKSLGLIVPYQAKELPSNGAVLLFSENHMNYFSNARIKLGRFLGNDKSEFLDHFDVEVPLAIALDQILAFIRRHTRMAIVIGVTQHTEIPQYLDFLVREAVTNAIVHTDYSNTGSSIQVAIFDDRIEITNPGGLPFGLTMEDALSGISQIRNKVICRVFRELKLIEQWGSGLKRMREVCQQSGIREPKFEELGNFFRATLYHEKVKQSDTKEWEKPVVEYLKKHKKISPKKAQSLWAVTPRTTSTRLKKMITHGILAEISTGPFDPQKTLVLR